MSERSFVEEEIAREKRSSPSIEIPSLCDRIREAWHRCRLPSSAVDAAKKMSVAMAYSRAKAMGIALPEPDDPLPVEERRAQSMADVNRYIYLNHFRAKMGLDEIKGE